MKKNMVLLGVLCALVMVLASGCKPVVDSGSSPLYAVGDKGPAGGTIFYVKREASDVWQYLEVAPVDVGGTYAWDTTNPAKKTVGTTMDGGKANTDAIILALGDAGEAAKAARAYTGGGKTDWFLPSYLDFDKLHMVKDKIPGLGTDTYWSSSEGYHLIGTNTSAVSYVLQTGDSSSYSNNKHVKYAVRAIRSF